VEACPTGALKFMEIEKLARQRRGEFLVSLVQSKEWTGKVKQEDKTK